MTVSHPRSPRSHIQYTRLEIIYVYLARSHPQLARYHPQLARCHPHLARSHPHLARSHPHLARSHPHLAGSHPHSVQSHPLDSRDRDTISSLKCESSSNQVWFSYKQAAEGWWVSRRISQKMPTIIQNCTALKTHQCNRNCYFQLLNLVIVHSFSLYPLGLPWGGLWGGGQHPLKSSYKIPAHNGF
jgi:hypothetical protein